MVGEPSAGQETRPQDIEAVGQEVGRSQLFLDWGIEIDLINAVRRLMECFMFYRMRSRVAGSGRDNELEVWG